MSYLNAAFLWLNDPLNWTNPGGIIDLLWQHIELSFGALLVAALVGLPLGIGFGHTGRGGPIVVTISNMTRGIPTVGMLTLLAVSALGLGWRSVIPALAIFAIPPILANAYLGMRSVDPDARDAAEGMGMSGWQRLWRVEVPLAIPYIAGGLRSAAVQVVATATLAALVAGGGLGEIISAGFGLGLVQGGGQIVAGGLLVTILALMVNAVGAVLGWLATPKPLRRKRPKRRSRVRAAVTV